MEAGNEMNNILAAKVLMSHLPEITGCMDRIPFDANSFINVIFGTKENNKYSCCWGNNDYKPTTNKRNQLTEERKGKDYNSFGNTKRIDF